MKSNNLQADKLRSVKTHVRSGKLVTVKSLKNLEEETGGKEESQIEDLQFYLCTETLLCTTLFVRIENTAVSNCANIIS